MSVILSTPVLAGAARYKLRGLVAVLRRCWVAYITWRLEQAAIAHLGSMSDRELKDIGLIRSEIEDAVRREPWERSCSGHD